MWVKSLEEERKAILARDCKTEAGGSQVWGTTDKAQSSLIGPYLWKSCRCVELKTACLWCQFDLHLSVDQWFEAQIHTTFKGSLQYKSHRQYYVPLTHRHHCQLHHRWEIFGGIFFLQCKRIKVSFYPSATPNVYIKYLKKLDSSMVIDITRGSTAWILETNRATFKLYNHLAIHNSRSVGIKVTLYGDKGCNKKHL